MLGILIRFVVRVIGLALLLLSIGVCLYLTIYIVDTIRHLTGA